MIVIDDKIMIHIVKTGGTSIKRGVFTERLKDIKFEWKHASAEMIPPEFKNYEKFTIVRNPLTWYESYYNYIIWKKSGILLAEKIAFNDGINMSSGYVSFNTFLERALDIQEFIDKTNFIHDFKKNTNRNGRFFFQTLWGDLTKKTKYKTLYQFFYFGAVKDVKNIKHYKMETDMNIVFDKMKISPVHTNISPRKKTINIQNQKKILLNDKILFDIMGYKKEFL